MYYRIAIQQRGDHLDRPALWQWKSTALCSLQSLFQVLRLYRALPQECLRVFSSSTREGLQEQLRQENAGEGSSSITAVHFFHQHQLQAPGRAEAASGQEHEATAPIAVSTTTRLNESSTAIYVPGERNLDLLERKRLASEHGTGGDHDLPYRFALPLSLPQVLAWTRLLGRLQRGEIKL